MSQIHKHYVGVPCSSHFDGEDGKGGECEFITCPFCFHNEGEWLHEGSRCSEGETRMKELGLNPDQLDVRLETLSCVHCWNAPPWWAERWDNGRWEEIKSFGRCGIVGGGE